MRKKNYYVALALAVAFLVATNVRADLFSITDPAATNGDGKPVYELLYTLEFQGQGVSTNPEKGGLFNLVTVGYAPASGITGEQDWSNTFDLVVTPGSANSYDDWTLGNGSLVSKVYEQQYSFTLPTILGDGFFLDLSPNGVAGGLIDDNFHGKLSFDGTTGSFVLWLYTWNDSIAGFDLTPGGNYILNGGNPFSFNVGVYGLIDYSGDGGEFNSGGEDTTTTPEPATLALMGLGLAGLGLARARRRK